jgi:5-methylthioadenosine/S-adenosylhomocysteine deaminase
MNKNRSVQGLLVHLTSLCLLLQTAVTPAQETPNQSAQDHPSRQQVDLIIKGDHIVSMDAKGTVFENAAVVVDEGLIIAIGPASEILPAYQSDKVLEGDNRVVMPGLINGHSHAAMTLLRGMAEDMALLDWLTKYIFPAEIEFVDPEFVRIGTELACWEMIRGGTTTFVDMYYYPDVIAGVVETCGMRALVSATVIERPSPGNANAADSISKGLAFIRRWQGKDSRITPVFGPHANYTLNIEQLRDVRDAAKNAGVGIAIHMSESQYEVAYSNSHYGMTSIELFDSIGLLDLPVIGAHVVWPTDAEIPILAARRVGVIHNPTSNMKTAAGVSPVARMLEAGVRVGLGTDGAASNNDLDMWEEMRIAAFLQKVSRMDPEVLPAKTVLNMATLGGAEAIGLGSSIGSLEVGKRADIIQVSFDDVHFQPTYDVISHLVYVADEQDVISVVVDGKILMQDRQMLSIDTARLKQEATELAARIRTTMQSRQSH